MEFYGIRGLVNNWLCSYLSNRQQFVLLDNIESSLLDVLCGVPQGSILGLKLLILYINDIIQVSKVLKLIIFADDTNAFCSGDNLLDLANTVSIELNKLKLWFDINKLSLNVTKTNYMCFSNSKMSCNFHITIHNHIIDRVSVTKFLGVLIDEKFNWKQHIDMVRNKLCKTISVITRSKTFLSKDSLYTLYCSMFLPYLIYCSEVWGNTYITNVKPISILQKKVVRLINKVGFNDHTNELFFECKIIKFLDLVKFKTAVVMYKARNKLLPINIQELFDSKEKLVYNLRGCNKFLIKHARIKTKSMCVSVIGLKIWNSLESSIVSAKSLCHFKKLYKKIIFSEYKSR